MELSVVLWPACQTWRSGRVSSSRSSTVQYISISSAGVTVEMTSLRLNCDILNFSLVVQELFSDILYYV